MATSSVGKENLRLSVAESKSNDLGVSSLLHVLEYVYTRDSGTSSTKIDRVYSDTNSVTASSPVTYDLAGSLTSILDGTTVTFAKVRGIAIRNNSSTTAQTLKVGAGSNPWITWLLATGDGVVIGPGGFFFISSPVDGYIVTAGTGDILSIDAGSGTVSFDILIYGTSV